MADNAVPTLAPETPVVELPQAQPLSVDASTLKIEKEALFDSIAHEEMSIDESSERSPLKTIFTGLLWFGYSVAVLVALFLVWTAASGMLRALSR